MLNYSRFSNPYVGFSNYQRPVRPQSFSYQPPVQSYSNRPSYSNMPSYSGMQNMMPVAYFIPMPMPYNFPGYSLYNRPQRPQQNHQPKPPVCKCPEPPPPPVYKQPEPPVCPPPPPPVYKQPEPPVCEPPKPPVCKMPEPPVCPPPPPPPPPCPPVKVNGSAGIYGDPKMGLFTPGLGNIPDALKNIDFNQAAGAPPATILQDPDGNLNVQVTSVQVNPEGNTGVGQLAIKSGSDSVNFDNSGNITVNGKVVGNINDAGFVGPITLPSGAVIGTSTQIDGPNGKTAERFFFKNGEYQITAALRSPAGANSYLDLNFEELTSTAADNATGTKYTVPGVTDPVTGQPLKLSMADLLRLEPEIPFFDQIQR